MCTIYSTAKPTPRPDPANCSTSKLTFVSPNEFEQDISIGSWPIFLIAHDFFHYFRIFCTVRMVILDIVCIGS